MNRYQFHVTLSGYGDNPQEAWYDAIESFYHDPGSYDDEPFDTEPLSDDEVEFLTGGCVKGSGVVCGCEKCAQEEDAT